jgi:hypothetical protein
MKTKWMQVGILAGLIAAQGCGGGSSSLPAPKQANLPVISGFNPSAVVAGDQVTVQITGRNFQSGATCDFGPGITVNLCEFVNDLILDAHLTVTPDAEEGLRTVTVQNPDGLHGSNATGFSVKSPAPATTGNLILNIGDAPVGNILSFSVVVEEVKLEPFLSSTGPTVLTSPRRVEISSLGATAVPIAVTTAPTNQGFCTMTVKFSSPEVTYLDAGGEVRHESATLASDTGSVGLGCSLDPPIDLDGLKLTSIPTVVTLDFDAGASLRFNGSGTIEATPALGRRIATVGSENPQHYWSGAIEGLAGVVTGVFANRFAVRTSPASFTFLTNASTWFVGLAGFGDLRKGMIVQIEATTGSDGQFTAKKVTLEEGSLQGQESRGIVTAVSGTPATQLTLVTQDSLSADGVAPPAGAELEVSLAGATFEMESERVDLTNLPFTPSFDASTLFAGQSVIVATDLPSLSPLAAKKIRLSEQAVRGSVSDLATNGGQTSFTLTLDSGSALTALTGATFLQVIQQPNTLVTADIALAPAVVARGLLFKIEGGYALVASKIGG